MGFGRGVRSRVTTGAGGNPPADVINHYLPKLNIVVGQQRARVQLFQSCGIPSTSLAQYSMILVRNGVIPALRTGLTVTLAALPDASSI